MPAEAMGYVPANKDTHGACVYGDIVSHICVGARQRKQRAHGSVRANGSLPDQLLNGFGQRPDQSQTAGNPTRTAAKTRRNLRQRLLLAEVQLVYEPGFFDGRWPPTLLLSITPQKCLGFAVRQHQRPYRVFAQSPKCARPSEAIDQDIAIAMPNHDHRQQLALRLNGRQES